MKEPWVPMVLTIVEICTKNHKKKNIRIMASWHVVNQKQCCNVLHLNLNRSKTLPTDPWSIPQTPTNSLCFGIPFIWGLGDVWGMLQGYVGFPLESRYQMSHKSHVGIRKRLRIPVTTVDGSEIMHHLWHV